MAREENLMTQGRKVTVARARALRKQTNKQRMESGLQEARGGSQADNGMDSHPGQGKAG